MNGSTTKHLAHPSDIGEFPNAGLTISNSVDKSMDEWKNVTVNSAESLQSSNRRPNRLKSCEETSIEASTASGLSNNFSSSWKCDGINLDIHGDCTYGYQSELDDHFSRKFDDPNVLFVTELCNVCVRFCQRLESELQACLSSDNWRDASSVEKVCVGLNNLCEAVAIIKGVPHELKLYDLTCASVTSEATHTIRKIGHCILRLLLHEHHQMANGIVIQCLTEKCVSPLRNSLLQRDFTALRCMVAPQFFMYYRNKVKIKIHRALAKQQILLEQNSTDGKTFTKLQREFYRLLAEDKTC
ncbi:uncharacterized protein LOC108675745 [Hyalella azteca]|uniref:Uncharacterized protein LOC108675745 n=1 Tax=Hyalella azteca TaxID=294128 RepID=A0A8B7NZT9_HYAAZ|nr:uncharacterized protein LOC108675745 [Hyalella azteca]